MADTMKCTCTNAFQDKVYGKQIRVVTRSKKDSAGNTTPRCTVCGGKPRWIDRVRLHAKEYYPGGTVTVQTPPWGSSPTNKNLCTENRMVKK